MENHATQSSVSSEQADSGYDCFISYRRSDGTKIARWLRRHLLSYRLPRSFRDGRARALSVYLDTAYERATDDYYDDNIAPALKQSRFLLVVATPSANETIDGGKPNWVEREIATYLETPQRNSILAVRAAGEWNDPFPGKLQTLFPYLHIVDARDVSNSTVRRLLDWVITPPEITALAAPLFGITQQQMPELRQEETRRARLRLVSAVATAATVLMVVASLGAYGWYEKLKTDAANQTILARYLAWQSGVVAAESPRRLQEGLLLAIEGYRRDVSSVTSNSLHDRLDQTPLPVGRFKHDGRVNAVKFTPDGKNLVSAGSDGNIRVWDYAAQRQVAQLSQDKPAQQIYFGPGQDEITATFRKPQTPRQGAVDAGRLVSWRWKEDTVTGKYDAPTPVRGISFISDHPVGIMDAGFWHPAQAQVTDFPGYASNDRTLGVLSPDSKLAIALLRAAKNIDVFDPATGQRLQSIPLDPDTRITALHFNRDGKQLLVGGSDGKTSVFDWRSNTRLFTHEGYSDPSAFAFSPDGKYIAEIDSTVGSSSLRIWRSEDGKDLFALDHNEDLSGEIMIRVAFSNDSKFLAASFGDRAVRIIRADDDNSSQVLQFTTEAAIRSIAFHPNENLLATGDDDGWVTLWRLDRGRASVEFNGASDLEVSRPDGRVALLGGRLRIIDSQLKATEFALDTDKARLARFSRSGKMLALGRSDGNIALVDLTTGKVSQWFDPGAGAAIKRPVNDDDESEEKRSVVGMDFSTDDSKLILVRSSGISEVDLTSLTEHVRVNEEMYRSTTFSPDGLWLASKSTYSAIKIFALPGFERSEIASGAFDTSLGFSPDSKLLAGRVKKDPTAQEQQSRSDEEDIVVWNVVTRQPVVKAPVGATTSELSFDSSSQYFAFTDDQKIQVWNLKTKKVIDLGQRMNEVGSIAFHPADLYLAAGYHDRKIRIWKLSPDPQVITEIPQDGDFDFGSQPVRFSRDGRFVLRLDGNGGSPFGELVSFLPWQSQDVLLNACTRALRKGLGTAAWEDYLKGQPYRETCDLPKSSDGPGRVGQR
jgi:WD40 repeat protein